MLGWVLYTPLSNWTFVFEENQFMLTSLCCYCVFSYEGVLVQEDCVTTNMFTVTSSPLYLFIKTLWKQTNERVKLLR